MCGKTLKMSGAVIEASATHLEIEGPRHYGDTPLVSWNSISSIGNFDADTFDSSISYKLRARYTNNSEGLPSMDDGAKSGGSEKRYY